MKFTNSLLVGALALGAMVATSSEAQAAAARDFKRSATEFVAQMGPGINIGNTIDVPSGNETEWGNIKITPDLFKVYKEYGFTTVRIPISWRKQFDRDDPAHKIKPEFMARIKEVVDWSIAADMVTIINIHHDGGDDGWPGAWLTIDDTHVDRADGILADIWKQIATTFRDYDGRLVFEGFNEVRKAKWWGGPSGKQKGQEDWAGRPEYFDVIGRYAKTFYDTVRATGGNNARRYLMVPTYAAAFQETTCANWRNPNPADNHIIATIHAYEPGDFCMWGNRNQYEEWRMKQVLDPLFDRFTRNFTDKGIPLVLGEVNANLRWYDAERFMPNNDSRVKWAWHYTNEARKRGFPVIVWECGGKEGMGLINRFKSNTEVSHPAMLKTFVGAGKGTMTKEQAWALADSLKVKPEDVWKKTDQLFAWDVSNGSYGNCWGQTMGYGNLNGNGKAVRAVMTSDEKGNLYVNTKGQGGNMVQQQFWVDQSVTARRVWRSWMKTHEEREVGGRKLVFMIKANNKTTAVVKGELRVPGIKDKIKFGADMGAPGCFAATPDKPICKVEIDLPAGAKLDAGGKGIGLEMWFLTSKWGSNLPLDFVLSPIELK